MDTNMPAHTHICYINFLDEKKKGCRSPLLAPDEASKNHEGVIGLFKFNTWKRTVM